jgi:hypothetical protein
MDAVQGNAGPQFPQVAGRGVSARRPGPCRSTAATGEPSGALGSCLALQRAGRLPGPAPEMPRHQSSRGPGLTGAAVEDSVGAVGPELRLELHEDFGWYAAAVFDIGALVPGQSRASVESDAAYP